MNEPAVDEGCRISVLGRFQVEACGRVILDNTWPRSKALQILKLLALEPGRSLHREQVFEALWPDLEPAAAANNLHKNLHYLRGKFREEQAGDPVSLKGDAVTLAANVDLDAQAFRTLAERARAARSEPQVYEDALALYVGDLLPDDRYEAWTEPRREQLRQLRNVLLLELGQLYQENGRPERGMDLFQQLLRSEPALEEAHRALMRIYARTGRRDRAFRQYEVLRETLRRELDVAPSQETEALYRQIADGRVDAGGASAAAPLPVAIAEDEVAAVPLARQRRARARPWLRIAVAALLLAGVGGGTAGGLLAGGVIGGGGPNRHVGYRDLAIHAQDQASVESITGDCKTSDLFVTVKVDGSVSGDITGFLTGSDETTLYAADSCLRTKSAAMNTMTDSEGNSLSLTAESLSVSRIAGLSDVIGSSSQFDRAAVVITGGSGKYAGLTGKGTCTSLSFITENSPDSPHSTATSTGDCALQVVPAADAEPVILQAATTVDEMTVLGHATNLPYEATVVVLYRNNRDQPQQGLSLRVAAPQGAEVRMTASGESPDASPGARTWVLPDLPAGAVGEFEFVVQVLSAKGTAFSLVPEIAGDGLDQPAQSSEVTINVVQ